VGTKTAMSLADVRSRSSRCVVAAVVPDLVQRDVLEHVRPPAAAGSIQKCQLPHWGRGHQQPLPAKDEQEGEAGIVGRHPRGKG